MENLVEGALVIEVHMKLIDPPTAFPPFVPENSSCKIIQGLFMDEESADIVFEVGGRTAVQKSCEEEDQDFARTVPCSSTHLAQMLIDYSCRTVRVSRGQDHQFHPNI